MGALVSFVYPDETTWDEKTIRTKYLVNKQIEDSKIKLKSVEAEAGEKFYKELKCHFKKKLKT